MTASLFVPPRNVAISANSRVLPGSYRYFYLAGTGTEATVYTDAAKSATRSQPVTANSGGEFPSCYVDVAVKVTEYTGQGTLRWTEDHIPAALTAEQVGATIYPLVSGEVGVVDYNFPVGDVRRYGAIGTGAASDQTALAAALASSLEVVIPEAFNCLATATLTLRAGTVLRGGKITYSGSGACLSAGNGCTIDGVALVGPNTGVYAAGVYGIKFSGASALSYASGLVVRNCDISKFGYAGVYGEWSEDVTVNGCHIHNCGYAGVMGLSVIAWRVTDCYIHDITPGTAGNTYGVSFTRNGTTDSLVTYPRSTDCVADGNIIMDCPAWTALDTHSGHRIVFSNNSISNCKWGVGVVATGSIDSPGEAVHAPSHCIIEGNTIDCNDLDGYGIAVTGADGAAVGTLNEYGEGNVVRGNTLVGCGYADNGIAGAIYTFGQVGLVVTGNTILRPKSNGIQLYADLEGMAVTGNVIIDPYDDDLNTCACIRLGAGNFTGIISGNALLKIDDTLGTYVGIYGLYWATEGTSNMRVGGNVITADDEFYNASFFANEFTDITDSTTGTASDTIDDSTSSVKDDLATLAAKINALSAVLKNLGILA